MINNKQLGTNIEFFQLVDIVYPTEFKKIIIDKQNIQQTELTAKNDRESELIKSLTKFIENEKMTQMNLENANNTANIILNSGIINKKILENKWESKILVFKNLQNSLNIDSTELLDFIESKIYEKTNKVYLNY